MKIDAAVLLISDSGEENPLSVWESEGAIWEDVRVESRDVGSRGKVAKRGLGGVWSRERGGGRERRRGAEERERRRGSGRFLVPKAQMLTLGKNPYVFDMFGEI